MFQPFTTEQEAPLHPIRLISFGYLHLPTGPDGQPVPPAADRIEDVRDRLRDPAAARIPPAFQHLHARAIDAEAAAQALREDNDRLRERVAVYAQVIHELRTELDRRTDTSTQRSPVRSLPTSIT
ncbi:hypothetical protein ACWEQ3_49075 [Streptomyces mirabilis]